MNSWEVISEDHYEKIYRMKVIGGWIVKVWQDSFKHGSKIGLTFVPDAEHKWVIENSSKT